MEKIIQKSPLANAVIFTLQTLRKPGEVGAVAPSSKYLGERISQYIKKSDKPLRVIEVGPGTGAFTKIIADKLSPEDHLDVIEYNPDFVKLLENKFKDYKNVSVHCISITDWKPDYKYDYMVSSLPFNVFPLEFVEKIIEHYENLMKPEGIISYFEYMLFPKIKKLLLKDEKKDEYIKTHNVLSLFRSKYEFDKAKVFKNFPPANVYSLKIKGK